MVYDYADPFLPSDTSEYSSLSIFDSSNTLRSSKPSNVYTDVIKETLCMAYRTLFPVIKSFTKTGKNSPCYLSRKLYEDAVWVSQLLKNIDKPWIESETIPPYPVPFPDKTNCDKIKLSKDIAQKLIELHETIGNILGHPQDAKILDNASPLDSYIDQIKKIRANSDNILMKPIDNNCNLNDFNNLKTSNNYFTKYMESLKSMTIHKSELFQLGSIKGAAEVINACLKDLINVQFIEKEDPPQENPLIYFSGQTDEDDGLVICIKTPGEDQQDINIVIRQCSESMMEQGNFQGEESIYDLQLKTSEEEEITCNSLLNDSDDTSTLVRIAFDSSARKDAQTTPDLNFYCDNKFKGNSNIYKVVSKLTEEKYFLVNEDSSHDINIHQYCVKQDRLNEYVLEEDNEKLGETFQALSPKFKKNTYNVCARCNNAVCCENVCLQTPNFKLDAVSGQAQLKASKGFCCETRTCIDIEPLRFGDKYNPEEKNFKRKEICEQVDCSSKGSKACQFKETKNYEERNIGTDLFKNIPNFAQTSEENTENELNKESVIDCFKLKPSQGSSKTEESLNTPPVVTLNKQNKNLKLTTSLSDELLKLDNLGAVSYEQMGINDTATFCIQTSGGEELVVSLSVRPKNPYDLKQKEPINDIMFEVVARETKMTPQLEGAQKCLPSLEDKMNRFKEPSENKALTETNLSRSKNTTNFPDKLGMFNNSPHRSLKFPWLIQNHQINYLFVKGSSKKKEKSDKIESSQLSTKAKIRIMNYYINLVFDEQIPLKATTKSNIWYFEVSKSLNSGTTPVSDTSSSRRTGTKSTKHSKVIESSEKTIQDAFVKKRKLVYRTKPMNSKSEPKKEISKEGLNWIDQKVASPSVPNDLGLNSNPETKSSKGRKRKFSKHPISKQSLERIISDCQLNDKLWGDHLGKDLGNNDTFINIDKGSNHSTKQRSSLEDFIALHFKNYTSSSSMCNSTLRFNRNIMKKRKKSEFYMAKSRSTISFLRSDTSNSNKDEFKSSLPSLTNDREIKIQTHNILNYLSKIIYQEIIKEYSVIIENTSMNQCCFKTVLAKILVKNAETLTEKDCFDQEKILSKTEDSASNFSNYKTVIEDYRIPEDIWIQQNYTPTSIFSLADMTDLNFGREKTVNFAFGQDLFLLNHWKGVSSRVFNQFKGPDNHNFLNGTRNCIVSNFKTDFIDNNFRKKCFDSSSERLLLSNITKLGEEDKRNKLNSLCPFKGNSESYLVRKKVNCDGDAKISEQEQYTSDLEMNQKGRLAKELATMRREMQFCKDQFDFIMKSVINLYELWNKNMGKDKRQVYIIMGKNKFKTLLTEQFMIPHLAKSELTKDEETFLQALDWVVVKLRELNKYFEKSELGRPKRSGKMNVKCFRKLKKCKVKNWMCRKRSGIGLTKSKNQRKEKNNGQGGCRKEASAFDKHLKLISLRGEVVSKIDKRMKIPENLNGNKEDDKNPNNKILYAFTKVQMFPDGSKSFEILDASPTPKGYFIIPEENFICDKKN